MSEIGEWFVVKTIALDDAWDLDAKEEDVTQSFNWISVTLPETPEGAARAQLMTYDTKLKFDLVNSAFRIYQKDRSHVADLRVVGVNRDVSGTLVDGRPSWHIDLLEIPRVGLDDTEEGVTIGDGNPGLHPNIGFTAAIGYDPPVTDHPFSEQYLEYPCRRCGLPWDSHRNGSFVVGE